MKKGKTVIDDYISNYSDIRRKLLEEMRSIITSVIPDADEVISYGMPAFKTKKVLVYFAAFKNHIGFYPTASGIKAFEKELKQFKHSTGAIQFPLDRPLPAELIKRITTYRKKEVD
ncbi:MAG: DUF1801 domain-containing protein [Bacteroidia bacterium]